VWVFWGRTALRLILLWRTGRRGSRVPRSQRCIWDIVVTQNSRSNSMLKKAALLLASLGVASAIHSVTLDTAGYVAYTDALGAAQITASAGVIQGMNLPYVLSEAIDTNSNIGFARQIEGDAAGSMAKYNRLTKETYVKLYVKCAGLGSTDTYSLSYALDGAASATVGTGYGSTANPFIMVEGLDDGMHSLVATCTVRILHCAAGDTSKRALDWVWVWAGQTHARQRSQHRPRPAEPDPESNPTHLRALRRTRPALLRRTPRRSTGRWTPPPTPRWCSTRRRPPTRRAPTPLSTSIRPSPARRQSPPSRGSARW
jgi:hypothetical protein